MMISDDALIEQFRILSPVGSSADCLSLNQFPVSKHIASVVGSREIF